MDKSPKPDIVDGKVMQKITFKSFIEKYSLGGICEAAHWYSDAQTQTLIARAHTETKTVVLKVTLKKWEGVETCKMALPSSTKLKSMLSPIGDELLITLNKVRDRIASFTVSDQDCEAICTVAEYDAFPETLDVDTDTVNLLPSNWDVEMKLTETFLEKMLKGVAALSEAKDFVLINNKNGGLDMVINYEDTNTNRIRIPVETTEGKNKLDVPLGFSTAVFKAIVSSNKIDRPAEPKVKDGDNQPPPPPPPPDPIVRVSSQGIAAVEFEDETFKSTYLLFPTRIIE